MPVQQLIKFNAVDNVLTLVTNNRFSAGRSCYLCSSEACYKKAVSKNLFSRALKSPVSAHTVEIDFTKEG